MIFSPNNNNNIKIKKQIISRISYRMYKKGMVMIVLSECKYIHSYNTHESSLKSF